MRDMSPAEPVNLKCEGTAKDYGTSARGNVGIPLPTYPFILAWHKSQEDHYNCHPEGGTTEGSFPLVPVKILRLRLRICMR